MKQNFLSKWKQGMMNITPAQQLQAQIVGTYGTIFGITFAGIFLVLRGMWYFIFVMAFTIYLQIISLIGLKQKYKGLLSILESFEKEPPKLGEEATELLGKLAR